MENNKSKELLPACIPSRGDALWLTVIGLSYFLAHKIALLFPDAAKILVAVWPAGGIGLAALLLSPRRLWPAILVALFCAGNTANLLSGRPVINSIGFMTANVLESLGCAWLITRWCGESVQFNRVKEILALVVSASLINACTSFVGAGTAALADLDSFWGFYKTWWIVDGLGILVVTPLIVIWTNLLRNLTLKGRSGLLVEAGCFASLWCTASWLTFQTTYPYLAPQPYMLYSLLTWAALRFGMPGVTLSLAMLAVMMSTSDAVNIGPLFWGGDSQHDRLLQAQLFLGVTASTGFLLAASYSEVKVAEQSSQQEQARLRALGDNLPDGMVYQLVRELDGKMRFLYVSAGVERLNGLTAEEVLGDPATLYSQIVEEDRLKVVAAEEESARNLRPFNIIVNMRQPGSQLRWMHLSSSPRLLADGRIIWDGIQRDITDIKRAEEELRESEKRYRILIQTSMDGVWWVDLEGRLLQVNEAYQRMSGYSEQELLSMHVSEMEGIESNAEISARMQQVVAVGYARFESKHRRKDGSLYDLEVSVQYLPVSGVRFVAFLRDITGRKQAEEKLKQLQGQLELILNSTWEAILELDLNGTITFANPAARQLLGFEIQEMISQNVQLLFHSKKPSGSHFPEEECPILTSIKAGTVLPATEDVFWRKDGTDIQVEYTCSPSILEGRKMGGVLTFWDITPRKEAEEAFTSLVSHAPMGIYIAQDNKFVTVNPGIEAITGYRPEELLGKETLLLVAPKDKEKVREKIIGMLKKEVLFPYECQFITKTGETRWVMETIASTQYRKKNAVLGYCIDISPLKQLEAQLVQAQKMEAIGTLAGGIAHDFNNILMIILGFTEMTLGRLPEGSKERNRLGEVLKAGYRARDLVQQILAFSRQDSGEQKPTRIKLVFKEALKMLRATIPTTIDFRQQLLSEAQVVIDPTQAHQIIMNLCTNAYHAMRETGGILEVSLEDADIDELSSLPSLDLKPGPYVKLTVSDTGVGMDSSVVERIFEPYFTTKASGEGTGLGLAMVHGIVKSNNGNIKVYSEPGRGSSFHIYLPRLMEEQETGLETTVTAALPRGTEHILVVDDEEVLVTLVSEQLKGLGYQVTSLTGSIEALALFQAQPNSFNLVITDQTMPQMTGLELSKELLRLRPDLPIILCSGFSTGLSPEISQVAGIKALLTKPVIMKELAEKVSYLLNNQ